MNNLDGMVRWALPVILWLLGPSALASPQRVSEVVRGLDGQPDLQLDVGRRLHRHPLRRAPKGAREWLSAVEKTRLDARRLSVASRLDIGEKLNRLIAIVRHRMPVEADSRYDSVTNRQVDRWGGSRLSHYAEKRVGSCRERAFLLKTLLDEFGIEACVRGGVLYDYQGNIIAVRSRAGHYEAGHAWVEAAVDGRELLLDPSMSHVLQVKRSILIEEAMPDGKVRQVNGALGANLIYVPTSDP